MGLNNMTKNQLVQFFTNVELRNLITKDKNKMKKARGKGKRRLTKKAKG